MDLRMQRKSTWRKSRYPSRLRHVWGDVRRPEHDWTHPSGTAIAGIAVLAAVIAAGVYYGPDFLRYMKIRRM